MRLYKSFACALVCACAVSASEAQNSDANTAEELSVILKETVKTSKETALLERDWESQKREFEAKVALLKAAKKSLEGEIAATKLRAKKESDLEKILRQRLAQSELFEKNLTNFLDKFSAEFEKDAEKNPQSKIILKNILQTLKSENSDVYSRAGDVVLALQKAIVLSKSIACENFGQSRYLRVGTQLLLDCKKSAGAAKIADMLEGNCAYDFVKIEISTQDAKGQK